MRQVLRKAMFAGCSLILAGSAAASAVAADSPFHAPGSVIGDGRPLKADANIQPAVQLFGDTIHAHLAVVADSKWVDPARLRVSAAFAPYTPVATPRLVTVRTGRFEQLTWTWTLRCLSKACVPGGPPTEPFHVFSFPPAQIRYLRPSGAVDFRLATGWPRIEVFSHLSPDVAHALLKKQTAVWQYSLAPVAAPTFRIPPALLFWLAIGLAAGLFLGALALSARWYLAIRPRTGPVLRGTPLERALALVTWAHAHGNETLERKAFERVADEINVSPSKDGLSETAHELAWQARLPDDDEVRAFTQRARETEPETSE